MPAPWISYRSSRAPAVMLARRCTMHPLSHCITAPNASRWRATARREKLCTSRTGEPASQRTQSSA